MTGASRSFKKSAQLRAAGSGGFLHGFLLLLLLIPTEDTTKQNEAARSNHNKHSNKLYGTYDVN